MKSRLALGLIAILFAGTTAAHDVKIGDLHISDPYARATVPGQPSGAAYLSIENNGSAEDRLLGASSPVAGSVEIHSMAMEGNVMKMREVKELAIKPSTKVAMRPGDGYHLMLLGLRQPLKTGDNIPLTLSFEKAGKAEVSVTVKDAKDIKTGKDAEGHHMH